MELLSFRGITPEDEKQIRDFLNAVAIIPLNTDVEDTAIRLRRSTRLKMPDAIVAASAIVSQAMLVTYDRELANTIFPGLVIPILNKTCYNCLIIKEGSYGTSPTRAGSFNAGPGITCKSY